MLIINNCITLWRCNKKYCSHGWQSPQPSHEPTHTNQPPIMLNKSVEEDGYTEGREGGVIKYSVFK